MPSWRICSIASRISSKYLIKLDLHEGWKFPDFLKYVKIRRIIRNMQKTILTLEQSSESEFKRYVDLIQIYDFVQSIHGCVANISAIWRATKVETVQELRACVESIQQSTQILDQIQYPVVSAPIQRIDKMAGCSKL